MLRLYHDEDSSHAAGVRALRAAGFDSVTAPEARMLGRSDIEQLEFAVGQRRVMYSRNTRDFCRLDAEWKAAGRTHFGIIVCTTQSLPIGVELRAMQALAAVYPHGDMANRLEFS